MGVGEREPTIDTAASVILLSGSGIANGIMTANVKCKKFPMAFHLQEITNRQLGSNCNSWSGGSMSFTDANSEWIWAYKSGASISSDSLSVNCPQHSNFGTTTFNLQSAAGGDSANPFTNTAALSSTASSSSGMSGSNTSISSNFANIRLTHGIMASVAFVIFMPLGAIIIRTLSFKNLIWVHASWMVFAYLMALAALGMGVWMAVTVDELNSAHAIIGIVVIGGVLLQPVTGLVHHLSYKRYGSPNAATYTHLWWGRAIITLAIINGGLGVQLAAPYLANLKTGEIIYGVVAGVMWLIWVAVIAIAFMKSRSGKEDETEECMFSNTSDGESRALRG